MKLYEFEGKQLLSDAGIPVPQGFTADSIMAAVSGCETLGYPVVVKAQVLQGGRKKAGGICFAESKSELTLCAESLLEMKIKAEKVETLFIEEKLSIRSEYYAGITLEPRSGLPLLILSPRGGIDIEAVAREYPKELFKKELTSLKPYRLHHVIDMVQKAGLEGRELLQTSRIVLSLIHCYFFNEALTAEINPLVIDNNGRVIAADAKFEIDDASLFRNEPINNFTRSDTKIDPLEEAANIADVSYVKLDHGEIGVISGGAGLGMATMDMIFALGGLPANFLDLGGDSTRKKTAAALRIVLQTPGVKSVLINIFGGTNNCETIALGISDVVDEFRPSQRIVVKMRGHYQDAGWALLEERRIPVVKFGTTEDAVREVL